MVYTLALIAVAGLVLYERYRILSKEHRSKAKLPRTPPPDLAKFGRGSEKDPHGGSTGPQADSRGG